MDQNETSEFERLVVAQELRIKIGERMGRGVPISNKTLQALLKTPGCPSVVLPGSVRPRYLVSKVWGWILASQPKLDAAPDPDPKKEGDASLHRRRPRRDQHFQPTG